MVDQIIMSMTKKWLVFVFCAMLSLPVFSQDYFSDNEDLQIIATLLKSSPEAAKSSAEKFASKHKEDGAMLAGLGTLYLRAGKLDEATRYFNLAQQCRRISVKALNLGGDIARSKNRPDSAQFYYKRAMYFARKDPDAYYKLADLLKAKEINKSIETLQILKKNRPDLNVQKRMAEVYYTANDLTNAIAAYKSIGVDSLDDRELMQYSLSLYIKKDYSQSLDLAQKGHKRASKDPVFNRLLLYNNTELQHFDTAISNADDLFNNSKDTKPQYQDYIYYGYALSGLGKTQEAIQQFNVALQKNGDIPGIHKEISDAYSRIHDYDNAIKYYEQYVANLKDTTDNRAYNIFQLGRLYWRKGINVKENETRTEDQTKAIEHSAELFGQVATLRPNSYLGFYWQAKANAMLDPEYTKGLAKPYYSKAAELLEKSGSSKDHLIECYKQLSYYYYINKEMNSSVEYAQKILELDPEDDFAKQMVALKVK
ncbi:tetratricopeptide repeat protein [Hoylesella shahii]|uniref:tetratricopeptide repeat protein n=1 Tax=Hoylesella shahii TaxID=228603 RepID=UPI0028EA55DF|nr:hypothetical protein [Hoylesella shahii]